MRGIYYIRVDISCSKRCLKKTPIIEKIYLPELIKKNPKLRIKMVEGT